MVFRIFVLTLCPAFNNASMQRTINMVPPAATMSTSEFENEDESLTW